MEIYDIDKLVKFGDNLYDLTKITFIHRYGDVQYAEYKVKKGEEMRIDLVCDSIYGSTDYIDIILNVNKISNPLNIKEGVSIIYPLPQFIEDLRYQEDKKTQVQEAIANPNKATKSDPSRKKYIEQGYSLPPTVLNRSTEQVKVEGDNIKVGKGLFNR
jgi:hypothetical protein